LIAVYIKLDNILTKLTKMFDNNFQCYIIEHNIILILEYVKSKCVIVE
jgi:hypothetical protein